MNEPMSYFLQQVFDGLTTGSIYALLALAIVITHRATGVANFAQGEMAMFSVYVAWQLTDWGLPLVLAIIGAIVFAVMLGMSLERVVIRPVEQSSLLTIIVVTLGVFLVLNQLASMIWTSRLRTFPSLLPDGAITLGGVHMSLNALAIMGVLLITAVLLYLLFQHTTLGLVMRAAAENRESSGLLGIRVSTMLMVGWGLAAAVGAVAGVMVAPRLFLEPNLMFAPLIFAFAAAVLGGLDSMFGAVIGGCIVGVTENLAGAYIGLIGSDLKVLVPLMIIVAVLLVRPNGLFGHREVVRV